MTKFYRLFDFKKCFQNGFFSVTLSHKNDSKNLVFSSENKQNFSRHICFFYGFETINFERS